MPALHLLGEPLVRNLETRLSAYVSRLAERGRVPTLAIVDATGDEASARFARAKIRACARLGLASRLFSLPPVGAADRLLQTLSELSQDPEIHGILLESPLPAAYRSLDAASRLPPAKDVEGLHPYNLGRLFAGTPGFVPATAAACLEMLLHYRIPVQGRHAVVVGRSAVVGRPVAMLLLKENATVTVCHSQTSDLAEHTRRAEILVVAAGQPGLVTASMVAPGAVVLDVGTNVTPDGQVVGDVDFAGVEAVASALTPATGGLGPVTTAILLEQTVLAAARQEEP
jgi:methylenetetrahydrofolate dehydrogenase (NADP+)/methenyltetrahydrofolate cyclohydrolase